jgi:hypothetical protein
MKLGYILMYVEEVSKTADFYERAFGVHTAFLHESGDYAEMETGQTRLGFVALPRGRRFRTCPEAKTLGPMGVLRTRFKWISRGDLHFYGS